MPPFGEASTVIVPPGKREWLAQVNGKRELWGGVALNTNLNYGNPAVRSAVVDSIVDYARQHPKAYYDICSSTLCQVYGGVTDAEPESDAAIVATAGEVLQSDGVSAYTEFIGGALLILGLLTRLAAGFVAINMFFAFFLVSIHHGLGSFDYTLAFAAIAVMLLFYGPGTLAIDRKLGLT